MDPWRRRTCNNNTRPQTPAGRYAAFGDGRNRHINADRVINQRMERMEVRPGAAEYKAEQRMAALELRWPLMAPKQSSSNAHELRQPRRKVLPEGNAPGRLNINLLRLF